MDSESERIFCRMQLHRLLVKHPGWSDQRLADELEKSESWVRKWRERIEGVEQEQFSMYLSQSRAPKTIWRQTGDEVKKAIAELRESFQNTTIARQDPKQSCMNL